MHKGGEGERPNSGLMTVAHAAGKNTNLVTESILFTIPYF